jgi:hypothetical protein
MSRFDFSSPGAAFVDEMTRVLAERKADERQKMLDTITMAAEERAKAQEGRDQAMHGVQMQGANLGLDERRTGLENTQVAGVTPYLSAGQDISSLPPNIQAILRSRGAITSQTIPTPSVSTDTTMVTPDGQQVGGENITPPAATPAPTREVYVGDQGQRDRQTTRTGKGNVISQLLASDNPEAKEAGMLIAQVVAADPDADISTMLSTLLGPKNPLLVFNEPTGRVESAKGVDGQPVAIRGPQQVIQRGYAPRTPAADYTPRYLGTSKDGYPIFQIPGSGQVREDRSVQMKQPVDPNEGPLGIPQGLLIELDKKKGLLEGEPGYLWDSNAGDQDIRTFRGSAISVIESAKSISPKVRELAKNYVLNPAIAMAMEKTIGLTEEESFQFKRLRDLVVPPQHVKTLQSVAEPIQMPKVKSPMDEMNEALQDPSLQVKR